jgi:signal transduction histidine kinase
MPTFSISKDLAVAAAQSDAADAQMVGRIRLVLAVTALLTFFIDPLGIGRISAIAAFVLSCYLATSIVIFVCSEWKVSFTGGRLMHWSDVAWFFVIVLFTGGVNSFLFLFFFFAILVSSLRWGFDEGARVTICSVTLFVSCGFIAVVDFELPRLLLRATFLLSLGYLIARLGENQIQLKLRLALLRSLSHLTNPRFGADRTITAMLEKSRHFFGAQRCIVVLHETEPERYSIRTVHADSPLSVPAEIVNAQIARTLLAQQGSHILLYRRPWLQAPRLQGASLSQDGEPGHWVKQNGPQFEQLADLLEADSFISAPVTLSGGAGRIYIAGGERHFGRADALFLAHIAAQGLPFVDSIELLDRIASDAAALERKKIALDLHDTAIQPYIGLKLGLAAICKKSSPANPLFDDLAKMLAMTDGVICQLRDYAGGVRAAPGLEEPICLSALRRQTSQIMQFYGVNITVDVEGRVALGDRLTAEVLQIVREGLSNICRHTVAQYGAVRLRCGEEMLRIEIDNDNDGKQPLPFLPRSISERAASLGGKAYVRQDEFGRTGVCVEIPV